MSKKTVFLTGATGSMGFSTFKLLLNHLDSINLIILVRPSKKNKKKLSNYLNLKGLRIIWGDLLDQNKINDAVKDSDIILHIGAVIPPFSDYHPEIAMKTNVNSMKYIIEAVNRNGGDKTKQVIYIGSISQYGDRKPPYHWCRTGDPISVSIGDAYSLSKAIAERLLAESNITHWASIRQTGMLCKEMLLKGTDPLTFHVPLDGVLEWSTVEDSARYMERLCTTNLPETFWRKFYNLGSGGDYRLTNIEFIEKILKALSCPPPEKIFETKWFARKNFHGVWYSDSDVLEKIIPSRENIPINEYMERISSQKPAYISLAKIVPARIIKLFMSKVANHPLAPLAWVKEPEGLKFKAAFGTLEDWENIPGWDFFKSLKPSKKIIPLEYGFDLNKKDEEISADDLKGCAEKRGGKCLSLNKFHKGAIHIPLEWECGFGHKFTSTPNTILRGGHWCEECLKKRNKSEEAKKNKFLAQILND